MDEAVNNPHSGKPTKRFDLNNRRTFVIAAQFAGAGLIWVLTVLCIFFIKDYGMGLFIAVPFIAATIPAYLATSRFNISGAQAIFISFKTLLIASVGILVFAIEGAICLLMAAPLEIIVAIFAGALGHYLGTIKYKNAATGILLLPMVLFTQSFFPTKPTTYSVVTSVVINAPPAAVWKNVVEFNKIPPPTEFIFKTGIAYPINATIDGRGVGAIRHCNFTTGSFVEPITVWDEPKLLSFTVLEQPEPMKEMSLYNIDPAHLHGYFVSEKGQFKLTDLGNGKTLLEGTTWYHHKISPEYYWEFWSDAIIHAIHNRVLNCVKAETEKGAKLQ